MVIANGATLGTDFKRLWHHTSARVVDAGPHVAFFKA